MNVKETIMDLCSEAGPSGFETPVAIRAKELLLPFVDEAKIDRLGNVIGVRRCGRPNAKKLLLDSHLDEIGLMVTDIEEGFLHFKTIGGVDPRMLPGREIRLLTPEPIFGVVACLPPHLLTEESQNKSLPVDEMLIDIGMNDEQAKARVKIGTPAVFAGDCFSLGDNQICGKSMDDRSCFVTLLRAMELLDGKELETDIYIMGSTQEEIGGRGATTGTFTINPDLCIAVDVTHGRTPDAPKDKTFELGGGAVIGVGPNMNRVMTNQMIALCKEHTIKYQLEPMAGNSGTNAWEMQICREGIATAVLSVPLKYMHSPVEVLMLDDVESVASLIARYVLSLKGER